MALHDTIGSKSYVKLVDGEVCDLFLNASDSPRQVKGLDGNTRYHVAVALRVDGPRGYEWTERTLALSGTGIRALALVCPAAGKVQVQVAREGEGLSTVYNFKRVKSEVDPGDAPAESTTYREPKADKATAQKSERVKSMVEGMADWADK